MALSPKESTDSVTSSLKRVLFPLRLVICTALLAYVFIKYDSTTVILQLQHVQLNWLVASLLLLYFEIFLKSLRWKYILRCYGRQDSSQRLFSLYIEAGFFNLLFPSFAAGDVSRIVRTSDNGRLSSDAILAVFLERLSGLVILCLYVTTIAFLGGYSTLISIDQIAMFIGVVAALLCILLFLKTNFAQYPLFFLQRLLGRHWESFSEKVQHTTNTIKSNPTLLWQVTFLSLLSILVMVLAAYSISLAINFSIPFHVLLAYVPLTAFITNVPISIAGVGVRENVYVFFFSALGFSPEDIITFGLTLSALVLLTRLSGGGLLVLRAAYTSLKRTRHKVQGVGFKAKGSSK